MARKYSKRISKRKYSKRRMRKSKAKRRITRRKKNIRGGSYKCPHHPALITGSQATNNTMTDPVAHNGEVLNISSNTTYWSNYDQIGDNVFGKLN